MRPHEDELSRALERCLDQVDQGSPIERALEPYPHLRAELEPLLRLAMGLRRQPKVAPSPAFVQAARSRLLERAAASRYQRGWLGRLSDVLIPRRWAASVGSVAAGLFLTAGLALASSGSLPGEPLYSLKLATEDAQLFLAPNEEARAGLHLDFANRRADEAARLAAEGRGSEAAEAIQGYERHLEAAAAPLAEGRDLGTAQDLAPRLQEALQRHEATLSRVLDKVPNEAARQAIEHAREVSRRGLERATMVHSDTVKPGVGPKDRGSRETAAPESTATPMAVLTPAAVPTASPAVDGRGRLQDREKAPGKPDGSESGETRVPGAQGQGKSEAPGRAGGPGATATGTPIPDQGARGNSHLKEKTRD